MIQTLNDIIHKYTVRANSAQYQEKNWNLDSTKKQQEIMSGLNDIEGLPYIIIQSGLPRLNIIRPSKKEIFKKKQTRKQLQKLTLVILRAYLT